MYIITIPYVYYLCILARVQRVHIFEVRCLFQKKKKKTSDNNNNYNRWFVRERIRYFNTMTQWRQWYYTKIIRASFMWINSYRTGLVTNIVNFAEFCRSLQLTQSHRRIETDELKIMWPDTSGYGRRTTVIAPKLNPFDISIHICILYIHKLYKFIV